MVHRRHDLIVTELVVIVVFRSKVQGLSFSAKSSLAGVRAGGLGGLGSCGLASRSA